MEEISATLKRIIQNAHTTSKSSDKEDKKCPICGGTTWVESKDGFKRCSCYKKEYIARLWKSFGVDPITVKKLNDYSTYDDITKKAKEKAVEYIKNFDEIKLTDKNSFGLFGQPGAGKSHVVIAIGAALLNRDNPVQVIYMPYLEVIRELEATRYDNEYYLKLQGRYQKAKVLIIDDLFKDRVENGEIKKDKYGNKSVLSANDVKHIMPIINYRYYNRLPTIISTECTPEMLTKLSDALAGRIIQPCGTNMVVFRGKKYNWRMKQFMK